MGFKPSKADQDLWILKTENGDYKYIARFVEAGTLAFDVSAETLRCTAGLDGTTDVNLEKALRLADRLGGHLVTGHVDGVGTVTGVASVGANRRVRVRAPAALARYIARKGSIAVDGVSLTVNSVKGAEFENVLVVVGRGRRST